MPGSVVSKLQMLFERVSLVQICERIKLVKGDIQLTSELL